MGWFNPPCFPSGFSRIFSRPMTEPLFVFVIRFLFGSSKVVAFSRYWALGLSLYKDKQ